MRKATVGVWLVSLSGLLAMASRTAQAEMLVWGDDYVTANRALNVTTDQVTGDGASTATILGTGGPADITPTNADYTGPSIYGGFSATTLNVAPTLGYARVNFRDPDTDNLQVRMNDLNVGTGADGDGVLSGIELFDFSAHGLAYRDITGVVWNGGGVAPTGGANRRTGLALQIGGQLYASELTNGFDETLTIDELASIGFSAYNPADLGTGDGGGNVRDYSYANATGSFDTLSNLSLDATIVERIGWTFEINSLSTEGSGRAQATLNTLTVSAIPEPSSFLLLSTAGVFGLFCRRWFFRS